MPTYLLVNFGGPRDLTEVTPFLKALLLDEDVIRTKLPRLLQRWLFSRIARKRARKVAADYELIGGRSPIYFDTEVLATLLSERLKAPVLTFHRYLPATHKEALQAIETADAKSIVVLPLFPQFCYATTGSIARFFAQRLSPFILRKMRWIKSYATHPAFIEAYRQRLRSFLNERNIAEREALLLFSAHGIPQSFLQSGDLYQSECESSFHELMKSFPEALGLLCYQSKFGPGEWLRPYTDEVCAEIASFAKERREVIFVPISFTSDHIETLFEVEEQYLPPIERQGLKAHRCPALNLAPYWIDALCQIAEERSYCNTEMLIRR